MMEVNYHKHFLQFKRPSGTSRGVLNEKESWFITIKAKGKTGIGECGLLRGLSIDDTPQYESILQKVCTDLKNEQSISSTLLKNNPSIRMGIEMALRSLTASSPMELYPSDFTNGAEAIPINGLVWMGPIAFMQAQIEAKLKEGFDCIKLKIGALNFEEEYHLLRSLRENYSAKDITIRVDANGAFSADEALPILDRLAALEIHSIEQPIAAGQIEAMRQLCAKTPLPIALDEELIGVHDSEIQHQVLATIAPQYIILKPSLLGGFAACEQWISHAEKHNIKWWVTSALESNVGLNAIAQWTATLNTILPQGLGTGMLYTNNFEGPLQIKNGYLHYAKTLPWKINF